MRIEHLLGRPWGRALFWLWVFGLSLAWLFRYAWLFLESHRPALESLWQRLFA